MYCWMMYNINTKNMYKVESKEKYKPHHIDTINSQHALMVIKSAIRNVNIDIAFKGIQNELEY